MIDGMEVVPNNYDILSFFKDADNERNDAIDVQFRYYTEPGEKHESGGLGDTWHIVICYNINDNEGDVKPVDNFEAILLEPKEYASNLIRQGFCGMLARKTANSVSFIEKFVDRIELARQEVLKYTDTTS